MRETKTQAVNRLTKQNERLNARLLESAAVCRIAEERTRHTAELLIVERRQLVARIRQIDVWIKATGGEEVATSPPYSRYR